MEDRLRPSRHVRECLIRLDRVGIDRPRRFDARSVLRVAGGVGCWAVAPRTFRTFGISIREAISEHREAFVHISFPIATRWDQPRNDEDRWYRNCCSYRFPAQGRFSQLQWGPVVDVAKKLAIVGGENDRGVGRGQCLGEFVDEGD